MFLRANKIIAMQKALLIGVRGQKLNYFWRAYVLAHVTVLRTIDISMGKSAAFCSKRDKYFGTSGLWEPIVFFAVGKCALFTIPHRYDRMDRVD